MTEILIGDKVISKQGEVGKIISFDDNYVKVQYQNKIATFLRSAFEEGYLVLQKNARRNEQRGAF